MPLASMPGCKSKAGFCKRTAVRASHTRMHGCTMATAPVFYVQATGGEPLVGC